MILSKIKRVTLEVTDDDEHMFNSAQFIIDKNGVRCVSSEREVNMLLALNLLSLINECVKAL